jgi:hypothetical protein
MLDYLDSLIGLAAIMLGLSLVVTILNQMVSAALALRGRSLHWGLATLVHSLHESPGNISLSVNGKPSPQLQNAIDDILTHPLVSDSRFPWFKSWGRATAIQFDEFLKVIGLLGGQSKDSVLEWLRENNRVTHPWFESMMARVSQHFAMTMRVVTVALALLLALGLHVDTVVIVNSLRHDQQLRSNFVAAADAVNKLGQTLPDSDREQLTTTARALLAPLDRQAKAQEQEGETWLGLILHQPGTSEAYFGSDTGVAWRHIGGVLLTAGLLSLGAPFWFNMLKSLSSLRSLVAKKEEEQRAAARVPDVGDGIQWIDLTR